MYDQILAPMKWDSSDEVVIEHVAALASVTGGRVTLLHVVHSHSRDETAYLSAQVQTYLSTIAARLAEKGVSAVTKIVVDEPADGIISVARQANAELIVMGTHGHSEVRHLLVGSVTEDVIRGSDTPVLLIRPVGED